MTLASESRRPDRGVCDSEPLGLRPWSQSGRSKSEAAEAPSESVRVGPSRSESVRVSVEPVRAGLSLSESARVCPNPASLSESKLRVETPSRNSESKLRFEIPSRSASSESFGRKRPSGGRLGRASGRWCRPQWTLSPPPPLRPFPRPAPRCRVRGGRARQGLGAADV